MIEQELEEEELVKTECICGSCGEHLNYTEEIFLVKVVQSQVVLENSSPKIQYYDVLDDDGEPCFEPYMFDFACWEETDEDVSKLVEDHPPVLHEAGIIQCDYCGSDILAWEHVVLVSFGELACSRRSPRGTASPEFDDCDGDKHMCITCASEMNTHIIELWDENFNDFLKSLACAEGLYARCWRLGSCACRR